MKKLLIFPPFIVLVFGEMLSLALPYIEVLASTEYAALVGYGIIVSLVTLPLIVYVMERVL